MIKSKKIIGFVLTIVTLFGLWGCTTKTLNNEKSLDITRSSETERLEEVQITSTEVILIEESTGEKNSEQTITGETGVEITSIATKSSVLQTLAPVVTTKADSSEPQVTDVNCLKIEGKVSHPLVLNLSELMGMTELLYTDDYYALNSFGTTSHTDFTGISFWGLLEEKAGILDDAVEVVIIATDGYEMTFTVEQVKKLDYIDETDLEKKLPMIIAWEENGQIYDALEGPPFKLVVGQVNAGDVNKPQWVSNVDKILIR